MIDFYFWKGLALIGYFFQVVWSAGNVDRWLVGSSGVEVSLTCIAEQLNAT